MRLPALIALLFLGCSPPPRSAAAPPAPAQAEPPPCPAGEFRGFGTDHASALSDLARQASSSVKVSMRRVTEQRTHNGSEDFAAAYADTVLIESELQNAHAARAIYNRDGAVVVCMGRAAAARGFLERQRLAADSLELASAAVLGENRPRPKSSSWRLARSLWGRLNGLQAALEGLGAGATEGLGSGPEHFGPAKEAYSKAREDYAAWCRGMKIHWEGPEGDCPAFAFSALAGKIKMEKSECNSGLRLRFSCPEKCGSASFGAECSLEPSLSVESCGGEVYSLLRAEPVAGSDAHNEKRARENLAENLRKASFPGEWAKEIKEWEPICAD